jgi:hypothetical protein
LAKGSRELLHTDSLPFRNGITSNAKAARKAVNARQPFPESGLGATVGSSVEFNRNGHRGIIRR